MFESKKNKISSVYIYLYVLLFALTRRSSYLRSTCIHFSFPSVQYNRFLFDRPICIVIIEWISHKLSYHSDMTLILKDTHETRRLVTFLSVYVQCSRINCIVTFLLEKIYIIQPVKLIVVLMECCYGRKRTREFIITVCSRFINAHPVYYVYV